MSQPNILAPVNERTEALFAHLDQTFTDITFGDVDLAPIMTDYLASDADASAWFTTDIQLRTPFISAAMDTITEHEMAIAMAKSGGIGVLHAALSPQRLKQEARAVKMDLMHRVDKPIIATDGQTVRSLMDRRHDKGHKFHTFPVVDADGKPLGVVSSHTLRFWLGDEYQTVNDFMQPAVSAPHTTPPDEALEIMRTNFLDALPLIGKHGKLKGMYVWADVRRTTNEDAEVYSTDTAGKLLVAAAVETRPERALERVDAAGKYIDAWVVDSSHGNAKEAAQTVRALIKEHGEGLQVVGGNIVDGDSAIRLVRAGAKAIKVGIGGGTICTTRERTGNGRPQLSAVHAVVSALREAGIYHIPVISDGGITSEGDATKAIAVGANTVMMGGRLAATTETPGEIIIADGREHKIYRGMGSTAAQLDARDARGYQSGGQRIFSEGVVSQVEVKGSVTHILADHLASLRNAIAAANATTLPRFQEQVFITTHTSSGATEATAHIGQQARIVGS